MGFFDKIDRDEFENFQTEISNKFENLEQEIKKKATDSEETARNAAENAVSLERNIRENGANIDNILKELVEYKAAASRELDEIKKEKEETLSNNKDLLEEIKSTNSLYNEILTKKEEIETASNEIANKIKEIDTHLEKSKSLPESVSNTQKLLEECRSFSDSIGNLLNHSIKRKSEIDELYKTIYGENISSSDGNEEHIDGLKDELERSYKSLSDKAAGFDSTIKSLTNEITQKHEEHLSEQRKTFEKLLEKSNERIEIVNNQLTGLLPGAMAEGLSAAYEKKKEDEILSLQKFEVSFKNAITGMVCVSLIPFLVDIYLLGWQGKDLVQVIKDTPSLIVSILPLYFPILWLAYSTNKKLNLSKRLIEEYTHKAVLGKTFSGLSNQIETLQHQGTVKEELRTRLLFNVLQVSAENPGKLITNYNKADHPLMEALENSAKLSDSVNALARIPGFAAIATRLSEKSSDLIRTQIAKVEHGLGSQALLESPADAPSEGQ